MSYYTFEPYSEESRQCPEYLQLEHPSVEKVAKRKHEKGHEEQVLKFVRRKGSPKWEYVEKGPKKGHGKKHIPEVFEPTEWSKWYPKDLGFYRGRQWPNGEWEYDWRMSKAMPALTEASYSTQSVPIPASLLEGTEPVMAGGSFTMPVQYVHRPCNVGSPDNVMCEVEDDDSVSQSARDLAKKKSNMAAKTVRFNNAATLAAEGLLVDPSQYVYPISNMSSADPVVHEVEDVADPFPQKASKKKPVSVIKTVIFGKPDESSMSSGSSKQLHKKVHLDKQKRLDKTYLKNWVHGVQYDERFL